MYNEQKTYKIRFLRCAKHLLENWCCIKVYIITITLNSRHDNAVYEANINALMIWRQQKDFNKIQNMNSIAFSVCAQLLFCFHRWDFLRVFCSFVEFVINKFNLVHFSVRAIIENRFFVHLNSHVFTSDQRFQRFMMILFYHHYFIPL